MSSINSNASTHLAVFHVDYFDGGSTTFNRFLNIQVPITVDFLKKLQLSIQENFHEMDEVILVNLVKLDGPKEEKPKTMFSDVIQSPEALAKFMVQNNGILVSEEAIIKFLEKEIQ